MATKLLQLRLPVEVETHATTYVGSDGKLTLHSYSFDLGRQRIETSADRFESAQQALRAGERAARAWAKDWVARVQFAMAREAARRALEVSPDGARDTNPDGSAKV